MFARTPIDGQLHPELEAYLQKRSVKSTHYDPARKMWKLERNGRPCHVGGLISFLQKKYYPHHRQRSRRRSKKTQIVGSNAKQGKKVDAQIADAVAGGGVRPKRVHRMAACILDYWEEEGHVLQAAQVPVYIPQWERLTAADCITLDTQDNALVLWEVKTGEPIGGNRKQGKLRAPLQHVDSTKKNHWHLQCHFTKMALVNAGVPIARSYVIQVHDKRGGVLVRKVLPPPPWTRDIGPIRRPRPQQRSNRKRRMPQSELPRLSKRKQTKL